MLCLRVLCRSLILWSSIEPSEDWINSQIPLVIKQHMKEAKEYAPELDEQVFTRAVCVRSQRVNRTTLTWGL